jgi:hypothetical protein
MNTILARRAMSRTSSAAALEHEGPDATIQSSPTNPRPPEHEGGYRKGSRKSREKNGISRNHRGRLSLNVRDLFCPPREDLVGIESSGPVPPRSRASTLTSNSVSELVLEVSAVDVGTVFVSFTRVGEVAVVHEHNDP